MAKCNERFAARGNVSFSSLSDVHIREMLKKSTVLLKGIFSFQKTVVVVWKVKKITQFTFPHILPKCRILISKFAHKRQTNLFATFLLIYVQYSRRSSSVIYYTGVIFLPIFVDFGIIFRFKSIRYCRKFGKAIN